MTDVGFVTPDLRRIEHAGGALVGLFRFAEMRPLAGVTGLVDWRLLGRLSQLVIDGFLTGAEDEALLVPCGGRLPQQHLLLLGLGPRDGFDRRRFDRALTRMFDAADRLLPGKLLLALPGRAEAVTEPIPALEWFLERHHERAAARDVALLEPSAAQQLLLPLLERWRRKQAVP